jgi:hypothetical protein
MQDGEGMDLFHDIVDMDSGAGAPRAFSLLYKARRSSEPISPIIGS